MLEIGASPILAWVPKISSERTETDMEAEVMFLEFM